MGIASVTAISCSHMLHYIKLCLWGATIRLMLSLILHMSTVALWSATRAAMPNVRGSKLGRTNSIFDKFNLKNFRSWWKWKIGGKLVTNDDATPPALVAVVSYQWRKPQDSRMHTANGRVQIPKLQWPSQRMLKGWRVGVASLCWTRPALGKWSWD